MELKQLQTLHEKAYNHGQDARQKAADDLVFYWVTQWGDEDLNTVPLQYRGQFDVLRKAGRQILSDLRSNPVQPDFKPVDESRNDDADILDGLYRAADRQLDSQEAYDYAQQDAVVCGFGAWEVFTEYATNRAGDKNQVIRRQWIPEANNVVFWDPSAKKLDKSDARFVSILKSYTPDGYKELVEELTGRNDEECNPSDFAQPESSMTFPWVSGDRQIYVATIYRRKRVDDEVFAMVDPFGEQIRLRKSDLEEIMDDLIDQGFEILDRKKIKRWEVRKFICSGKEILNGKGKGEAIAGEHIPVVPMYGERSIVEGEETYEGITRMAKDPQRLRNFQLSYLQDIVSRSPRPKPIFFPAQVAGFENMYENSGADDNYPYYLNNQFDANGNPLPVGPVAVMPEQQVPAALLTMIDLSRQAVEDVANPGMPQDIADPDLSGKAVLALQNRVDQQAYIYQHNYKFAKRRDAEIFASMASEIFDSPRNVTIETPDGNRKEVEIMSVIIDKETGEPVTVNDLTNMEFDVYAEIGPSYASQKQKANEDMLSMMSALPDGDPMKRALMLTLLENADGDGLKDIRKMARKQLVLEGIKEPETEEELAMLQQAQGGQKQDPAMVLALAEQGKAEAAMMSQQRQAQKDANEAAIANTKVQIDAFNAETSRMGTQIEAEKANADIQYKQFNAFNTRVQTAAKIQGDLVSRLRGSLTQAQR
jgi:hypothetical protein